MGEDELKDRLNQGVKILNLQLSDTQITQLYGYLRLIEKWNRVYNLTAIRQVDKMLVQHIFDSLAVAQAFENKKEILDVGAGAGLPGIVLAIIFPDVHVSLVDAVQKKAAFMSQVKAELKLENLTVYHGLVEELSEEKKFDAITSRAFASLEKFVTLTNHLMLENGTYIAMKGLIPNEEINALPENFFVEKIEEVVVPTLDAQRHLIIIKKLS